ncbi:hypothetical protein ABD91_25635 [Lysinibacillus sphaericus]|uniref:hypothetical protein n=1 Tax=Lysinibacillus sphaericus TaxID=1421 RepID=UPI0018CE1EA9|nr:hypothetical protein [Lysinibacillus sphaericus]MBG9694126.1 hypothetical protein [Lysinibacillus sphaericus]
MQILVMYLLLAVVGCIAVAGIIMNFGLEKKVDSISKTIKGLVTTKEDKIVSKPLNITEDKLNSVLEGLEFYKNQSEKWHSESVFWKRAYDKECESLNELEIRFKKVEKEVSSLRYIVDKMDGREIVRDDNYNITQIRLVK